MARDKEMSQEDIDAKLAALEEPQEEVEVEQEEEEVEEVEESATSPDDTDEEEPATSVGDEDDEEEEVELTTEEDGLLKTAIAERKKRQESDRKLEEIQTTLATLQETVVNSAQPRTLEEAYERDSKGVIDNINSNIQVANDAQDIVEVERLRDLKSELRTKSQQKSQSQVNNQQKQTEIITQLSIDAPGFLNKDLSVNTELDTALADFAIEKLGYEFNDLQEKTSIAKHGMDAVKEIGRIFKAHKIANIPTEAKKKKKKKATVVEKSGTAHKKAAANAQGLIDKARKSGSKEDWMDVIEKRFG